MMKKPVLCNSGQAFSNLMQERFIGEFFISSVDGAHGMKLSDAFSDITNGLLACTMSDDPTSNSPNEQMMCPHCGHPMNISGLRPFSKVDCPACGQGTRVHTQLGVYRILDCVGRGGMSEIFRAEDTILGRIIALKILNENYSSQKDRVEKFEQEAQIMAKVRHENIVKVYTVGRAFGHVFIAMELVNGRDLETLMKLRGEPIPEPEALEIALQSVEGLMAADDAGLVHRDVKPANILLDASGTCKIVDFGLSLLQSEKDDSEEIWVTPYYASPEALRRELEDSRSDMYALGVTLFQMLSGKTPFETIPSSVHALLDIKKKIPSVRRVAPELSPMTRHIVDKLMNFDKEKRYQSYAELRDDLIQAHALLASEDGDWRVKRSSLIRRYKRNRFRMIAAICAGGILLAGGIVFWITSLQKVSQTDVPPIVKEEEKAPVVHMMNGEEIGQAYLHAEETLKSGYLDDARRQFERLLDEQRCPLATAAWSALNAAYACWILGDDHHGRFLMQQMVGRVEKNGESAEAKGSAVDVMELMKALLASSQEENVRNFEAGDPMLLYWLVGSGLKAWKEGNITRAASLFARLEELSQTEGEGISGRTWNNLLSSYIQDAASVKKLMSMPDETLPQARTKLDGLMNPPDQQSPGTAYKRILASLVRQQEAHVLDLKERSRDDGDLSPSGQDSSRQKDPEDQGQPQEDEQARIQREREQEEIRRAQEAERQQEAERLKLQEQTLQKNRETVQKGVVRAVELMEKSWNFSSAMEELRKVEEFAVHDDSLKGRVQAYLEMASLADGFMAKTLEQSLRLPQPKRQLALQDGTTVQLQGYDKSKNLITVMTPSGRVSRPAHDLGIHTMIRLHRACLAQSGAKPAEERQRHRDALVFMFLAGGRESAVSTMEKWLLSSPDNTLEFMNQWQGWMIALDE